MPNALHLIDNTFDLSHGWGANLGEVALSATLGDVS